MRPPILVTIPISNVDAHLAEMMLKWVAELGPCPNHPCLLVLAPDMPDKHRFRPLAEKVFPRVYEFVPQLYVDEVGWPDGANAMFRETAKFCHTRATDSFYFLEPDNTPLKLGWMDLLQSEWDICGKPFMGVLENSWMEERIPDPVTGERKRIPSGKHLVGTAIYHKNALPGRTQAYMNCKGRAFDVACQRDIAPHSFHTNLIQHNWLTHRYRLDPDRVIRCERREGAIAGQIGYSLPRDLIVDHVAVLHGCKDGSLIDALREYYKPPKAVVTVAKPKAKRKRSASKVT